MPALLVVDNSAPNRSLATRSGALRKKFFGNVCISGPTARFLKKCNKNVQKVSSCS
jgi:hypothetical protein